MALPEFNQKRLAKELKLSTATVSKSLRNHPDINAATRARVLELASRRGYQPALRATAPATGGSAADHRPSKSRFVGVLFYDRAGPSGPDVSGTGYLAGLSEAAQVHNVSLVVHRFNGDSLQMLSAAHQPAAMRDGILDGLVLIHRFEPEVVRALARDYRLVTLTHSVYGQPVDHIDVNHGAAIAGLVDRMYALGHRRFGFVGRRPELAYNQVRFGSFAAAMARMSLPLDPASLVNVFSMNPDLDQTADTVAAAIRAGVTAWVAASDYVAYELWRRLERRGIDVPRDASLSGFDGLDTPLFGCPPVATARVPYTEMGGAALTRLLARINNSVRPARQVLLNCELIPGQSLGPAAGAAE